MHFGEIVKRKRMEKGYTGDDIAAMTGVAPSSLSRLEAGKRGQSVNLKTIQTFAKALGLTFVILPDDTEEIKAFDAFKEVQLQGSEYSEEDLAFIKDPTSEPYIRLAKLIKKYGYNNEAVKSFAEVIERYTPNK